MPLELFANNATTTLSAGIDNLVTSLSVVSSALFPAAVTGVSQFRIILDSEIMIVTNVSGTTWTVTRGAEGTTAAAHTTTPLIYHEVTAEGLTNRPPMFLAGSTASGSNVPLTQSGPNSPSSGTIFGGNNNRGAGIPFTFSRSVTPTSFKVSVIAASATSFVALGIYADNGLGKPGSLITDYGQVDASTTGVKSWANTNAFQAGRTYWYLVVGQGTNGGAIQVWLTSMSPGVDVGDPTDTVAFQYMREGFDITLPTNAMPANITSLSAAGGVNSHVRILALIP